MTHTLRRELKHVIAGMLLAVSMGASSQDLIAVSSSSRTPIAPGVDDTRVIVDSAGRTSYQIQFAPSRNGDDASPRRQAIESMADQYGFTVESSTVDGNVLAAFLDDAQAEAVRTDPRVTSISATLASSPNSNGVWKDSGGTVAGINSSTGGPYANRVTQATEVVPWGKKAMNGAATNSNGNALIYVLDVGIAPHIDLNVVEWVLPSDTAKNCGTRIGVDCTPEKLKSLVGCYTHATAVAGIAGAKANGTGTQGIDPNAQIVSVSYAPPSSSSNSRPCNPGAISGAAEDRVTTALKWIKQDIKNAELVNPTGRPRVVNISLNWENGYSPVGMSADKNWVATMKDLATPAPGYPGAFIAQSAGNHFEAACQHAYNPVVGADMTSDGIMVVSAINSYGQPIVPLNGKGGFWKNPIETIATPPSSHIVLAVPGSNWGPCVEAWAPGDAIFTTVGGISTQSGSVPPYNTYAYMSGTSFAAPHVAGLAAYLIETQNLLSPGAVEQRIRYLATQDVLGSKAPSTNVFPPSPNNFHSANGVPISMPSLNPLAAGIPRNKPYAEITIASACIYPLFQAGSAPAGCKKFDYRSADQASFYPYVAMPWVIDTPVVVNGWSRQWSGSSTWITFDSYGIGSYSCDVWMRDFTGNPNTTILTGKYGYLPAYSTPGYRQYGSTACPSLSASFYM